MSLCGDLWFRLISLLVQFVQSMDHDLLTFACKLYHTTPAQLIPLSGGHYNAVYQFPGSSGTAILRIGLEDCPPAQTLAMLEWVSFLAANGAPVSAPIYSDQGNLLESFEYKSSRYTVTAFQKVNGILAENIPPAEWTPGIFRSIGQAVGRFHRISASYPAYKESPARPYWYETGEIAGAQNKLRGSRDPADEKLTRLIHDLRQLPISTYDYGLIHGDLHFANFLISPGGAVTIIDFDDCCYGWFAMDIAMALFDVLVLYNPQDEAQAKEFASEFLSNYLAGYQVEYKLSPYWQNQIPLFLKLKELCIYAGLVDHPDATKPGTWVGDFMRGRSERIANDIPYVVLDNL